MVARKHRHGPDPHYEDGGKPDSAVSPTSPRPHHRSRSKDGGGGGGGQNNKWILACSTGGFTTLCVIVTYHVLQSLLLSQQSAAPDMDVDVTGLEHYARKTLAFEVCNGMANQRLALLYGILLAFELGRTPVLPDFILSGVQMSDAQALGDSTNSVKMSYLYDVEHFITSMATMGIEVLDPRRAPPKDLYTRVDIGKMEDPVEELSVHHKTENHLEVGCPLFKLHSYYFSGSNSRVMWSVLLALKPANPYYKSVKTIIKRLRGLSHHKRYNFLHLRMENDWVEHCKRWETIPDGKIRNNCMNNTDSVEQVLLNMNVPVTEPLYLATFWEQVNPTLQERILGRLASAGYKVVTSRDFKTVSDDREVNALVEYEVGLGAHKFLGNSVSTFSALAIYQRRYLARWSSYYNSGNVPLAEFLPTELLPWVFTYTSYTPQWDYMVKAAVRSALRYKTLQPYCIYTGNHSSVIYNWLGSNGVILISHRPAWADELWHHTKQQLEDAKLSRVYKTKESVVDDFMRIDLPALPELEQFVYVLFTEADFFFHKKINLGTFRLPLPETIGMAVDEYEASGVDGGIMLVNLPAIRETYEEFKLFVLGNRHGAHFPNYGVGGMGAYLQFYESSAKAFRLESHFAAKPYREFDAGAYTVHFKGPKPHDYMHFFHTDECPFGKECDLGFRKGLCPYTKKWHTLVNETEEEIGLALWYACATLYAPHLQGLSLRRSHLT